MYTSKALSYAIGGYSNHLYPNAHFGLYLAHIRRESIQITKLLSKK